MEERVSVTTAVKEELARVPERRASVRGAELASILRFAGGLHIISGRIALEVELDSRSVAARVARDLGELYGVKPDVRVQAVAGSRKQEQILLRVLDGETLARQTGLLDSRHRPVRGLPNKLTTGSIDDLVGVWRGAFLAQGALTDPGRQGSLEVVTPTNETAMALVGAASRLGYSAKAREVRGVHRVVVREPEAISSLLRRIGAGESLGKWETIRAQRETRHSGARLVNFDDANLRRSAQAAVLACARVERALEILGAETPVHLRYAGELRLAHREASLDELGHHAQPPMTKDAVAGRIRRLLAMADKHAQDLGIPTTEDVVVDDI